MSDIIEKIVEDFEIVRKEFQAKAQTALKAAFKEFFDANPTITEIYWNQYTPYFNDGDECNFSVNDMFATVGEITEEERDEYIEDRPSTISGWGSCPGYEQEQENFKEFTRLINRLPDEIFESTFGNHAEITATREGFNVDEYSHD